VFREVRRVLRKDGTLWLNLGDTHAGSWGARGRNRAPFSGLLSRRAENYLEVWGDACPQRNAGDFGLKPKDLVGIPWMVAFALRSDGWWLRSDIVWVKQNPIPESVTDRPTMAHEYVFLLSKSQRYFYDCEAVKESSASYGRGGNKGRNREGILIRRNIPWEDQPTRNMRDVWDISPQPFKGEHFAVFPEGLAERCILAGTSEGGCCSVCGAPYERVVERKKSRVERRRSNAYNPGAVRRHDLPERPGGFVGASAVTLGWKATCDCNAEVMPCTVLDPFGGSGTVSLVAKRLGRSSIYCDLNPRYCEIAVRRCGPWNQPRLDGEDTYEVIDLRMGEEAVP